MYIMFILYAYTRYKEPMSRGAQGDDVVGRDGKTHRHPGDKNCRERARARPGTVRIKTRRPDCG